MLLTYKEPNYLVSCKSKERALVKEAGFERDPVENIWFSRLPEKAMRFYEVATKEVKKQLDNAVQTRKEAEALTSGLSIPTPAGLTLFPYQKAGVQFLLNHNNVLLADSMGLGKTCQVIGLINLKSNIEKILVICPASLKLMWRNELNKWLTRNLSIGIAAGGSFPESDIVIINYDILPRHYNNLRECIWDLRVTDETHFIKNSRALRTKHVIGHYDQKLRSWDIKPIRAARKIAITGTPIVNRPVELWSILTDLDPIRWGSYTYFINRYCNAHSSRWGLDVSGASHHEELKTILKSTIMIRRLKAEVLTELPPKMRQIIEFPVPSSLRQKIQDENEEWERRATQLKALQDTLKECANEEEYRESVRKLKEARRVAFNEMSKVRHETALLKLPVVISFLREIMENGKKVVVFGHHRDMVEGIHNSFADSVLLYGGTPKSRKQKNIETFQNDPTCTMFVGSIMAAGVGITLTAASHVVFAELDWVPGNMVQAEDRLHRISQLNPVLVQILVYEGSLDARMAKTIVKKQCVIERIVG
jgi:SWI/SNF-related matrix-associated actin-dependent regulator 1 of chromatin subfamily A